jgi:hypothetical protein
VVELYKGLGRARDLLAIGARSPAQATEKALGTFAIAAKGQVSVCPRCQKWSHDFHGDAARLQKAVQRFHEVLAAGPKGEARAAMEEADAVYRAMPKH